MGEHKIRDQIDLELSRTYFGNVADKKTPPAAERQEKEKPQEKKEQAPARSVRSSSPVLKFLLILWIITIAIFVAGYFLRDNRIIFSLSINVEKRPAQAKQASEPEAIQTSLSDKIQDLLAKSKKKFLAAVKRPSSSEVKHEAFLGQPPSVKREMRGTEITPLRNAKQNVKTLYDFQKGEGGWEIPFWALDKPDHVAKSLKRTRELASSGDSSLELDVEFPGDSWSAALIEVEQFLDLGNYDKIQADVFIPQSCPSGLRGKLILTTGEEWRFVEMARSARLTPGEWTTITASLSENSKDWRRTTVDKAFKNDVRKIAIRVESNRKPAYAGPIFIDNIRVTSKE